MRYLVTGGAGFIGSAIARALVARGDDVTVLDDFSSGRAENLAPIEGKYRLVRGDLVDASARAAALEGAHGIFHEAAVASVAASIADPVRCDAVNVHGTVALLADALARGTRRIVFAASAAAYGDDPALPKRETMAPAPISPYGASKVAAEHYLRAFSAVHGMHTVALRYFNIFGPGQDPASEYAAVLPKFLARLDAGQRPVIFGDGSSTRDFCYIDNVVDANLRAMTVDAASGQCFNVASGATLSVRELGSLLARLVGRPEEFELAPARAGDIVHSSADIGAATAVLGYRPVVGVEEGLRRTVAAWRGQRP